MTDPQSRTLRLLQDMRRDNERVAQNVTRCMEIVIKAHERFAGMSDELSAFRAETNRQLAEMRKQLAEIQGDILRLENQNMSRHGETIDLLHDVRDLQARIGVNEAG